MPKFFQTLNRATDEQTDDIIDEVRALRGDMAQQSHLTIQTLEQRIGSFAEQQTRQNEQSEARLRETLAATEQRQAQLERTVAASLERIRSDNEQRLEQMRQTVDERLTSTLSKRLDASFEQVGAQLKQVYTGLGEMQRLAGDLGDFKRVLTNVKARGTWAEVQLGALLEQVLAPNQYEKNACVVPGSLERVEYAIVLPGDDSGPVKLPIDSKFPQEDYLRIVEAGERADAAQMEAATNALKRRLLSEAQPPARHDRLCDNVPAYRGAVLRGHAHGRTGRDAADAVPCAGRGAEHAVRTAQQSARGLPDARNSAALQRGMAIAGQGEEPVRRLHRAARAHARKTQRSVGRNRPRRAAFACDTEEPEQRRTHGYAHAQRQVR